MSLEELQSRYNYLEEKARRSGSGSEIQETEKETERRTERQIFLPSGKIPEAVKSRMEVRRLISRNDPVRIETDGSHLSSKERIDLTIYGEQRTPEQKHKKQTAINAEVSANFSEIGDDERAEMFIMPDLEQGALNQELSFFNSVNSLYLTSENDTFQEERRWQPLGVKKISIGPQPPTKKSLKKTLSESKKSSLRDENRVKKSKDGRLQKYIAIPKLSENLGRVGRREKLSKLLERSSSKEKEISKQIATRTHSAMDIPRVGNFAAYCRLLYDT